MFSPAVPEDLAIVSVLGVSIFLVGIVIFRKFGRGQGLEGQPPTVTGRVVAEHIRLGRPQPLLSMPRREGCPGPIPES